MAASDAPERGVPLTTRARVQDAFSVALLSSVMVVSVAALPMVAVGLLLWFAGGDSSSGSTIELLRLPHGGWDIVGFALGWFFVICFLVFSVGMIAVFLSKGFKVVSGRPPLTVGLRQLLEAYSQTLKEFSAGDQ